MPLAETIPVTPPELPDHSSGSDFVFLAVEGLPSAAHREAERTEKLLNLLTKSQKCNLLLVGFVGRKLFGELFVEISRKHPNVRIPTERQGKVTGRKIASNGNHRGLYGSISTPCAQCRADEECSVTIWQQMGSVSPLRAEIQSGSVDQDLWDANGHTLQRGWGWKPCLVQGPGGRRWEGGVLRAPCCHGWNIAGAQRVQLPL